MATVAGAYGVVTYTLDPSMSQEGRERILTNFARMAIVRSDSKRTLLKAVDETRSLRQNAYYWQSLSTVQQHMREHFELDHAPEVWHELFKSKFAIPTVTEVNGETVKVYRSTKDMTKKEFAEYMEKVADYCAVEYGCAIPPPEHVTEAA